MYLLFHRIIDNKVENTKYFEDVDIKLFDKTIKKIKDLEKNCEGNSDFFVTFDDGFASCYHKAISKLREYNINCIFFIVPKFIGENDYLSWEMIKDMSNNGVIFGSHSYSHQDLTSIDSKKIIDELSISKNIIEQKIGLDVHDFSYPYGKYNYSTNIAAFKAGYKKIYNSNRGFNNENSVIINRNSINSLFDYKKIEKILQPTYFREISWYLENFSKKQIKGIFGDKNYLKFRSWIK